MAKHHNKPDKHSVGMNHHHVSKEEHKECHKSDGQRHAEGMKQIRHDEDMHERKNTGK
jgi:hypothetical protein